MDMLGFRNSGSAEKSIRRALDPGQSGGGIKVNPYSKGYCAIAETLPDAAVGSGVAANASAMVAGTRIATAIGWRSAEMVAPGDRVLTFDNGMQEVTRIHRAALWPADRPCPHPLWPLFVPVGALGNAQPMTILPEQSVVVESDVGEELYGDPFTLIPALALDGFRGILRHEPNAPIEVVTLFFAQDEVVFAAAGALFFCPVPAVVPLTELFGEQSGRYATLSEEEARALLARIGDSIAGGVQAA